MTSPFMTQRAKSKFVFASPSKSAETLKYISPEQVPIQYGGLSVDYCECNPEFTVNDLSTEINVKPATKQTVEIKASKLLPNNEPVMSNSFKVTVLGKLLPTIDNPNSKKKKLLYRLKIKPLSDCACDRGFSVL